MNDAPQSPTSGRWRSPWARELLLDYVGMLTVLIALILLFSSLSRSFWSLQTFSNLLNEIPDLTLVAVGMTFVLIIGGIDLSVGSVMALSGAVLASALRQFELPLSVAILAGLGVGLLCGLVNGSITVFAGLPSFIVTLGMLELARGSALLVSNYETQYLGLQLEAFRKPLGGLGVSPAVLMALGAVLLGQVALTRTVWGRRLIAVGTNQQAVRLSGIQPWPYQLTVFGLMGVLSGMAAIAHTAKMSSAYPDMGVGLELSAIAAVVIGGTSLMGGRGSVVNSFFGVLIIAVLQTGLDHISLSLPWKQIVTGSVIIAAVLLDLLRHRAATSNWLSRLLTRTPQPPR